jgi:RNA polymerase sigma factor (sigma-70 family)
MALFLQNTKTEIVDGAVLGQSTRRKEWLVSNTITEIVRDLGHKERMQFALTLSDTQLVEQFARYREEEAFEALLHRHGPLVFSVCRRMLFDLQDAEDAFQATFLVFARKAGSITDRSLLSNWLYGVAFRVASRVRKNGLRRQALERQAGIAEFAEEEKPLDTELAALLHEEVQRLPDKYRGPVVLCYVEGKSNEEAAGQLQWPVGTVKTRLGKARELLRSRLARRGVALTSALLVPSALCAAVPTVLLEKTFQTAIPFTTGNVIIGGAASPALTLATGVIRTMWLAKLKLLASSVLAFAFVLGMGGFAYQSFAVEPAAKKDAKKKEDKDVIQGTWKVEKVEEDGADASESPHGKLFMSKPLAINADKIVMEGLFEMTYKLDPTAKIKTLDLDNGGGKMFECVYTLDGDSLKICSPVMPGGDRPSEVATKAGSKTRLLILKREAKDK